MSLRNPVTFREFLGAAGGFLALSIAFCASVVFQPADVAPFNSSDAQASFFPYYARTFHPLSNEVAGPWDPTLWTGLPESHSPFGRYLPTVWILCELLPLGAALTWIFVLHHALAGLGSYLLMRVSGFSKGGSAIAGIVFSFSSFIILHRPFVPMFLTCVWLPWVFWSLEMFRHTRRPMWVVATGTFLACHVLGAHSQMIVMSAPMWVLYGVYFSVFSDESGRRRLGFGLGVLAACVLGVTGGLPQLLPMMEVGSWTPYREFNFDYFKNGSFEPRWLPGLAGPWVLGGRFGIPEIPNYQGSVECGCFFGLLPLALAVIGAGACWHTLRQAQPTSNPTRREIVFWLLVFWINVLLMLGRYSPLYRAMAWVPVYNMFHVPARHLWIVALAVAWLCAMGFEQLRTTELRRRLFLQVTSAFAVLAVICLAVIVPHRGWHPKPTVGYPGFIVPIVSGVIALLVIGLALNVRRRAVMALVAGCVIAELHVSFGNFFLAPFRTERLLAQSQFPEAVRWLRSHATDNEPLPRCFVQRNWVPPGLGVHAPSAFGSAWGLSVLNCYSQSMPGSLARLLSLNKYGEARFQTALYEERGLSATGGRYIVHRGPLEPIAPGLGYLEARRHDWQWADRPTGNTDPVMILGQVAGRSPAFQKLPYLIEGEIIAPQAGTMRLTAHEEPALANRVEQELKVCANQPVRFALILPAPTSKYPAIRVVAAYSGQGAEIKTCNLWCLNPEMAMDDALQLAERLHATPDDRYRLVATCEGDVNIYENPRARPLASFVPEVRRADGDLAAAKAIIEKRDRPVTDVAYTTTDLAPRRFSAGVASVSKYLASDFAVKTKADGEGFLVLTVTRCRGWSATIDGERAPIHAVDGPLMGVVIPPGEHEVRLQFRPVLLIAGMTAAGLGLGGSWLVVMIAPFVGARFQRARQSARWKRAATASGSALHAHAEAA